MEYAFGPQSEYVCPAQAGSTIACTTARATSSAKTGCCFASPSTSGSTGIARDILAMRLSRRSSSPKMGAHLRMVVPGNASLMFSSPTALDRAQADGLAAEAPSADM